MMRDPEKVPESIKKQLQEIGLWDVHSANLFRISWKNEQKDSGGLYGGTNHIILPPGTYRVPGQHHHAFRTLVSHRGP